MRHSSRITGSLFAILILASSLLAGCAPAAQATPLPTQDVAPLVDAAVKTLSARITEEALRNPTATQVPTNTPEPTATPVPPTATPGLPTETPTLTATSAPAFAAKFLNAGTFPENKFEYVPNEKFNLAVRFKNVGTMAWQPGFTLKLTGFQGEITVQKEATTDKAVAPGEAVEFDLWAFGSEMLGTHIWYFQLYSNVGAVPGGSAVFSYTSK
jgi:hypothetical protein